MAITRLGGANAITGTIPTSVAPGQGKILQVSNQVIISTEQTLSTNTYTDLTSATLNITPSSTSNKIFLSVAINCRHSVDGSGYGVKFVRDSSGVFTTTNDYLAYAPYSPLRSYSTVQYIDSPSSTSQITYKVQVASYFNNTIKFNNSAQSTFYAMEIAG